MNRTLGILTLSLATAAGFGVSYACDHDCAGKSADCAARHADCAAKHADCAAKSSDCAAKHADCAAKNSDCAAKHADCAAKHADCAAKHADCAAKQMDCAAMDEKAGKASMAEGQECCMTAEQCTESMRKDAETHGWLGIGLDVSAEDQMSIGKIWADSPAEKAGLQLGDRLVALNGIEVGKDNGEKIFSLMKDAKIGDKVTLDVLRGSDRLSLHATLGKMPEEVLAESIQKHIQEHHNIAQN